MMERLTCVPAGLISVLKLPDLADPKHLPTILLYQAKLNNGMFNIQLVIKYIGQE